MSRTTRVAAEPTKYLSIPDAAAFLGVSTEYARKLFGGIKAEIGRRYDEYAVIGHGKTIRASTAVIADYSKFEQALRDPVARASLPDFDIVAVERKMGLQAVSPAQAIDYDALAAACIKALIKTFSAASAGSLIA